MPTTSGNRDRTVTSGTGFRFSSVVAADVDYTRDTLLPASMDWLPVSLKNWVLIDGRAKLAHGHPNRPGRYICPNDLSLSLLNDEGLLVLDYTHVQGYRIYDDETVLNPGNVGQPHGGDPWAAYAIVNLDAMEIETECADYDIDRVAERVRKASLPERLTSRLYEGK